MPESETNKSLLQLVYVSAAAVEFTDEDLYRLLSVARENNEKLDVTGVLLFKDNTFFQVLEGDPEVVQALYDKIELDPRHNNVLLLASRSIDLRNFGQWSMGFMQDQQDIAELPGFVDFFAQFVDDTNVSESSW